MHGPSPVTVYSYTNRGDGALEEFWPALLTDRKRTAISTNDGRARGLYAQQDRIMSMYAG